MNEWKYNVGRGHSCLTDNRGWTEGVVFTPHGIVEVYAQGDDVHRHSTRLRFFKDGYVYCRLWNKRYSHRGIATKAKQFAKELSV
jgi:hypothetical protein